MKLISSREVIEILGIKLPTLYAWVQRGKLIPMKVGKLLKFSEEDVRAMITVRSTLAWLLTGPAETAVSQARRRIDSQPPDFRLTYLQPPEAVRACVSVEALGGMSTSEESVQKRLEGAFRGDAFLFLGTTDPWAVEETRPEESGGRRYLAAWIRKVVDLPVPDPGAALDRLRSGVFSGKAEPWTREEIHGRES